MIAATVLLLAIIFVLWYMLEYLRKVWKSSNGPEVDYSEYTGFGPPVWGPQFWFILHITAINISIDNNPRIVKASVDRFKQLIEAIRHVIPCGMCKEHFDKELKGSFGRKLAFVHDRRSAFLWTVEIHNAVNQRLGKTYSTDPERWFNHYTSLRRPKPF